ncbi:hypothetical protein [Massilia horti]|uniref:Uncharacterized protein n=1 Tax=Massilia horti TaxID=2562153 RepID=A0A4Y9SPT4_9BURK|nr:hypothetical protein [Massilia horti]TFW27349.1 hypothetical protein E4O92_24225 [Massilia horti]
MRILLALCLLVASSLAAATNYTLWINGRTGGGTVGDYNSFTYWGPASTAAGVNKKAVNWDGYSSIASQSGRIRDALDCFCTGANWCYIATHSAGDLILGYTLANYGGSARVKKDASPNSSGVCGNADGTSQTGWNIKWVRAASGAGGGSELADGGAWATGNAIDNDLKTQTARAMYNHNQTYGIWFYMYAGAKGTLYSGILPGQDDEAVAYHSTGGVSGSAGGAYCNPADWFCNDLTLGTAPNEGGSLKWSYHSVSFRDDAEAYNHYTNGNWAGIVSVVRSAMVNSAL